MALRYQNIVFGALMKKRFRIFFYLCDFIQPCLDWLQLALSDKARAIVFLEEDFVFSTFDFSDKNFQIVILTATYVLKAHIWKQRTRADCFGHKITERGLLQGFKNKLKERIRFDFHRLPRSRFIQVWSAGRGLVEIKHETIFFSILIAILIFL